MGAGVEVGGAGSVPKRGKLVNKHGRWMSLLKLGLIQAIRRQGRGVWEEEVTYVCLMALNTEVRGVGRGYR